MSTASTASTASAYMRLHACASVLFDLLLETVSLVMVLLVMVLLVLALPSLLARPEEIQAP